LSDFANVMVNSPTVTPEQVRAARAWLGWSRDDLSKRSGISPGAIGLYEQGRSLPYDGTLAKLKSCLETAGIEFLFAGNSGTGIRKRDGSATKE
jgi:ribosome-binding protein aMBF1 (putative translation factor)